MNHTDFCEWSSHFDSESCLPNPRGVIPTDGWKIAIMLIGIISDTKSSPKKTEAKSDTSE